MILHARSSLRAAAAATILLVGHAEAKQPSDLAGTWTLSVNRTGAACRILLRADRSDTGDYFLGVPPACRHAIPVIATVGRWAMPDDTHLTLDDPGGRALLALDASGNSFAAAGPDGTYTLKPVALGRSAGFETVNPVAAPVILPVPAPAPAAIPAATTAAVIPVQAPRHARGPAESAADLAGRYAVMREKRDTGCMLTLDRSPGKGGDRAQLAPGCRDQGIVIFDPAAWQIVRGDLVLTARAGHKTRLEKQDDGVWAKDPKEGGKPLGLKKL